MFVFHLCGTTNEGGTRKSVLLNLRAPVPIFGVSNNSGYLFDLSALSQKNPIRELKRRALRRRSGTLRSKL